MNFSTDELIPFSDARSGLSRVIEDVMGGRELVVTRHGKMTVALVAASQFYQYREMERELNEFLAALEHDKSGNDTKLALACWRRSNIDHLCRLNFDQGLEPAFMSAGCG